jgi:DNA-binding phage protein
MRVLEDKDVVALLRAEVRKFESTAAWARSASLDRTHVSSAIHQRRSISKSMLRAPGLQTAVVDDDARVLTEGDIRRVLRADVAAVGSQAAWAKKNQMSRLFLNRILRKVAPPSENIIRALGLRIVVISD